MACRRTVPVKFADESIDWLKGAASRRESTVSGVVRDAVALARWVEAERANGARVIVETSDGRRRVLERVPA